MKTIKLSPEKCENLTQAIDDLFFRLFESNLEDASLIKEEREGYLELLRFKKSLKP